MNRCRNLLRTRSRRPRLLPGVDPVDVGHRLTDEPIGRLHAEWAVEEMLDGLTPDERAVFVLHYVADLSLRDVASTLALREGTVKTRLHAGLKRLRAAATAAEGVA